MDKIKVYAENLKATISGIEYTWCGGFGAVIKSRERGVKLKEVRMIGNVIFYASMMSCAGILLREVCWVPQQELSIEWIREFKKEMFGVKEC